MKPAPRHPLHLPLGLIVWSAWFVVMYAGLTIGCVLAPPPPEAGALTWVNGALGALTAATIAGLLWYARACWRAAGDEHARTDPLRRFVPSVGAAVHLAAAIATFFVALPLLRLPPCL